MSKEKPGESTSRTKAAYLSVREQIKKTEERADSTIERLKKKLERHLEENDHTPSMKVAR